MATNYFRKYGLTLLNNGYSFIPIIPATAKHKSAGKAPAFKGWQNIETTPELLQSWLPKYPVHGIGIHTRFTPAVDIDCTDEDGAKHMIDFVLDLVGPAPTRVGRAPKTLLLYTTEDPFTKVKSHVWEDELGDLHAVEILGSGQQFVAFGIHPGTKKPYTWGPDSPLNSQSDIDLCKITLEQAREIAKEFDRYAKSRGWTADKTKSAINGGEESESWTGSASYANVEDDDYLDDDIFKVKWEGTVEELAELMADLPPEDAYDRWFPVLAALKDAEREPDEFREIAREWSSRSDNYDEEGFNDKWDNGNFNRLIGQVRSINSIVRSVEKLRREKEVVESVVPDFQNCVTLIDWKLAASRLSEIAVFGTVRDVAIEAATVAFKSVTGLKKITASALADLAYDFSRFDPPEWLKHWVFDLSRGAFVSRKSFTAIGPYAFNMSNARYLKEIGVKKAPDKFAAEDYPIPMVDGTMYYPAAHGDMAENIRKPAPGYDDPAIFMHAGRVFLNTFDPKTLPAIPDSYTKGDLRAIETVKNFFNVQFPDPRERRYLMDWIAWVVNNPTKKINYALVVVGCEGSGKTIIKKFMTYLLGGTTNVGTVSNTVLQKAFTSWAEGHILKVIEEISIPGHRYDVVNTLKEPIANESLQTEGKHRDASEWVNTASYLAFTNDRGGIPVGDESRRYLIVSSRFEKREMVLEYMQQNPSFFKSFERAFLRNTGGIRKWFSEWTYSEDFNHEGHAPDETKAKIVMRDLNRDALTEALEDAISSKDVLGVTPEIIHAIGLSAVLEKAQIKPSAQVTRRLSEMGFEAPAGKRLRVRLNGVQGTVYLKNIENWAKKVGDDYDFDVFKIRTELQKHADSLHPFSDDDEI